jgi:hypothetical protein
VNPWGWCGVCSRRLSHDWDPFWEEVDPGHYLGDGPYQVALGNGLFVDACWSCWMKWPGEHTRDVVLRVAS